MSGTNPDHKSANFAKPSFARSALLGPERDAEHIFAHNIRVYRDKILEAMNAYAIPAGYNVESLMWDDAVMKGFNKKYHPEDVAELIARSKGWAKK